AADRARVAGWVLARHRRTVTSVGCTDVAVIRARCAAPFLRVSGARGGVTRTVLGLVACVRGGAAYRRGRCAPGQRAGHRPPVAGFGDVAGAGRRAAEGAARERRAGP